MHFFEKIDRSIDKQIYKQSNIVIDTKLLLLIIIIKMLSTYSEFLKDFDTTFPNGPCADVIDVEKFVSKYKILIERTTNTIIEELNMFNCVDFKRRMQKCFYACEVTKYRILSDM